MDLKEYRKECRKSALRIEKQLIAGLLPHQPPVEDYEDQDTLEMKKRGTVVYVMSITNPHKNTTAGTISMVSVTRAGQLLFDVTHELASPSQIAAYHAEQKKRLEDQKADIVKYQKLRGQGADPELIDALKNVVQAAVDQKKRN